MTATAIAGCTCPAQDAEGPSQASLEPRHVAAQEWAAAHTRACERIAGERFVARSLAAATVVAGLTSIIWHVYVDDDDHYGTAFGIWTGVSVASLMGTVYKAFTLSRAKRELRDLGPPSFTGAGTPSRLARLGGRLAIRHGDEAPCARSHVAPLTAPECRE